MSSVRWAKDVLLNWTSLGLSIQAQRLGCFVTKLRSLDSGPCNVPSFHQTLDSNVNAPAYLTARAAAARVRSHLLEIRRGRQHDSAQDLASLPDEVAIEAIVDCAFWASLRREEGYIPRISLAFLSPAQTRLPLTFAQPIPLSPEALTRLAPAVERPGIHLGVWQENGEFYVWGATRTLPALCFVVEVVDPGLLVIKRRRIQDSTKFVNVAVLEGDQIKVLDHQGLGPPDSPALVASLLGVELPSPSADFVRVLIQLSVSMRAHGRGGALLIVPQGTHTWRDSIVGPTPYTVLPPYSELGGLLHERNENATRQSQETLRRAIEIVAGLTAVDGATVLTDQCEVLAFGAKIGRREGYGQIEHVIDTEPIEGAVARVVHPAQLGGTRHLSAAQFAQDQNDSVAMVASQDGRFTVFAWSPLRQAVQAYRVESLLL